MVYQVLHPYSPIRAYKMEHVMYSLSEVCSCTRSSTVADKVMKVTLSLWVGPSPPNFCIIYSSMVLEKASKELETKIFPSVIFFFVAYAGWADFHMEVSSSSIFAFNCGMRNKLGGHS